MNVTVIPFFSPAIVLVPLTLTRKLPTVGDLHDRLAGWLSPPLRTKIVGFREHERPLVTVVFVNVTVSRLVLLFLTVMVDVPFIPA